MSTRVKDEHGKGWLVDSGDPANEYVLRLKARGFTSIVLPAILLTGDAKGDTVSVERVAPEVPRHLPPKGAGDATRVVLRAQLINGLEVLLDEHFTIK